MSVEQRFVIRCDECGDETGAGADSYATVQEALSDGWTLSNSFAFRCPDCQSAPRPWWREHAPVMAVPIVAGTIACAAFWFGNRQAASADAPETYSPETHTLVIRGKFAGQVAPDTRIVVCAGGGDDPVWFSPVLAKGDSISFGGPECDEKRKGGR